MSQTKASVPYSVSWSQLLLVVPQLLPLTLLLLCCSLQHHSSHVQQQNNSSRHIEAHLQFVPHSSTGQAMLRTLVLLAVAAAVPAAVVQLDSCKLHSHFAEAPSMALSVKVSVTEVIYV
jgi:hypothetical protein